MDSHLICLLLQSCFAVLGLVEYWWRVRSENRRSCCCFNIRMKDDWTLQLGTQLLTKYSRLFGGVLLMGFTFSVSSHTSSTSKCPV
ncbi:hypothetical protein V8C44DRAFT_327897 [Trichoderma aethiopicum]